MSNINRFINLAKEKGAHHVELFCLNKKSRELRAFNKNIRYVSGENSSGYGARIIIDNKVGFAYTTDYSSLEWAIIEAISSANNSSPDPNNILPQPEKIKDISIYNPEIEKVGIEDKKNMLLMLEREALNSSNLIKPAEAIYNDRYSEISIINSNGINYSYKKSYCSIFLRIIAQKNNDSQSAYDIKIDNDFVNLFDDYRAFANDIAQTGLSLLGGKKIKTCKAPVIFSPPVACQFVGFLTSCLSADEAQKNKSFLADKLGQKIALKNLNIVDDGTLVSAPGASPVDDEGIPADKKYIINNGVLETFLHNSYTAKKAKVHSTGNAKRGSFKSIPSIGPNNIYIKPTNRPKDIILSIKDECFYVLDISGLHAGANPITGEISVGATGLWLKNGKSKYSVREVTISANMINLLNLISEIGNDLKFYPFMGSCGAPTILIDEMSISGE